jgi:hypothetical protein
MQISLNVFAFSQSHPQTVTGSFSDGRPHGHCKVELEDGRTVIGQLTRGFVHGYYRVWDSNGTLLAAAVEANGEGSGLCWRTIGNSMVLHRCQKVGVLTTR